jgi:hypothetical protein
MLLISLLKNKESKIVHMKGKKQTWRYQLITAEATNKAMAWMLIRSRCHELKIDVPTIDKITRIS